MPVPEIEDLDGRHVAAIVSNHVDEAEGRNDCFHLVVVERILAIGIIFHHPAGMPAPAVAPEIQGVMVGRIVGFGPGDKIDQRLWVAKVALAPVIELILGGSLHTFGDPEQLCRLPVAMAGVIAGTAIGQSDHLHIRVGGRKYGQLCFKVTDHIIFEIVIPRDIHHHRPFGVCCRRRGGGGAGKGYQEHKHHEQGRRELECTHCISSIGMDFAVHISVQLWSEWWGNMPEKV